MRPRTETLLNSLVGEYIETACPVASVTLARKAESRMSSATVRNEMAELEEEGYIVRPHVSSGAVPSDKGYRFYVERLGEGVRPPVWASEQIRQRFWETGPALDSWVRAAAQMLAGMVDTVAIVTFPGGGRSRLKRIELVYLREFLALLIVVLQGARLLQQMVPLSEPASHDELTSVANKLSFLFAGLNRSQMEEREAELTPLENQVRENALSMMQEAEGEAFDPHVDGLQRALGQPEFSEGERVSALVSVLEDKALMRKVLAGAATRYQVQVLIGRENREEALWPFSLVLCPYGFPDGARGILGVLGPTRLPYPTALGGVRFLSSVMTEIMDSVQGSTA